MALALSALWTPLNVLVLPDQVSSTVPTALRGSGLGLVTALGLGLAVLVQPLAGYLSDTSRGADRRRPFILNPGLVMVPLVLLVALAPQFVLLLVAYLALQTASNVLQAAFQPLVSDLFSERERDRAASVKAALDITGIAAGLILAGALLAFNAGNLGVVVALALFMAVSLYLHSRWVPPIAVEESVRHSGLKALPGRLVRSLKDAPPAFRSAVWMRLLFFTGLYPVQRFLLFFLEERFDLPDPATRASLYLVVAILVAGAAAAATGWLSERVGSSRILSLSVVLTALGLVAVGLAPTLPWLGLGGLLLALGSGAFQSANWAQLSRAVTGAQSGQLFGIANLATAGASALVGLAGPLVDVANRFLPGTTYQITFGLCAVITLASLRFINAGKQE